MISQIKKIKATTWGNAGKYDADHNRHVLLAMLIGVGTIALFLLKFIWSILTGILGETNRTSTTDPYDFPQAQDKDLDMFGRDEKDFLYQWPTSSVDFYTNDEYGNSLNNDQ